MTGELDSFAHALVQDVITSAEAGTTSTTEAFTQRVIEDLQEAAVVEDGYAVYHRSRGVEVSGYGMSPAMGSLDLFVSHFRQQPPAERIGRAELEVLRRRLASFVERCLSGRRDDIDESTDAWDMSLAVESAIGDAQKIRLFILTNATATVRSLPAGELCGLPVTVELWDLRRLHRLATSGTLQEPIVVDFPEGLPCLANPVTDADYATFLAILPGDQLARIYAEYGTRVLELNVRSFLQTRGAVNRGIRETLLQRPERFLAYNNGISATASRVELDGAAGGLPVIRRIHDLQIVNGGQTTASIHHAYVRDRADLSGVRVQTKLTVVSPARLGEIVPEISRFSNTQNRVTSVDFSSNDAYFVALEQVTRSLWAPARDGSSQETKWFFERARGQYADELARERTPRNQREFKLRYPAAQKISKADIAKFENSWLQRPHLVSRGAEKNFREFVATLGTRPPAVDVDYAKRMLARAILFRGAERTVSSHNFGGYRANIVTFTVAKLANATAQRVDLDRIWREQRLSPALEAALSELCVPVHSVVTSPPRGMTHVGEWTKRPDCWVKVQALEWRVPAALEGELIDVSAARRRETAAAAAPVDEEERRAVEEVTPVVATTWFEVSRWAKETDNLGSWQRSLAYGLGTRKSRGQPPTARQAVQGRKLLKEALDRGFRPTAASQGSNQPPSLRAQG
jgi:AIPR protein